MKGFISTTHICMILILLAACVSAPSIEHAPLSASSSDLLSWDSTPNSRVVLATFCCDGPVTEVLVRPYIPEAQIWGDGRFLWTERNTVGERRVMEKQLSTVEMTELQNQITTSGFFGWEEQFMDEPIVDAASLCLTVSLSDQTKKVCTTNSSAPDEFYILFDWLAKGADMSGRQFWPERAYLTGFYLEDTFVTYQEQEVAWPESIAHLPVKEAVTGTWLEDGDALQLLWEAVNQNIYHMPIVREGESRYRIILQVPGVSWIEP